MMELTPENKKHIDSLSYEHLLREWRFSPGGSPWFQGETGAYWKDRMNQKRAEDPAAAVAASKQIGW